MTGPTDTGPTDTGQEAGAPVPDETPGETPDDTETDDTDAAADFEGPRRRARREREERRTAQTRATAIEQARREAKKRAAGKPVDQSKTPARGLIRGLKLLMWSALVSVVVVGLGLVLYFTPVMAARETVISGLNTVSKEEVEQAAAIVPGTPLLQIDTDAVAERVATIRRVASARVQREYPSTLRITIAE